QLIYRGTRQWCRRHEPGVILGVYTVDELEDAAAPERQLGVPPPAPPRGMITAKVEDAKTEVVEEAERLIDNPDGYIADLEESLVCAKKDGALIAEVMEDHKPYHPKLPKSHQEQADVLFRKYNKEAAQAALGAKKAAESKAPAAPPKSTAKPQPE